MATIASRLPHDERVLAAIAEEDQKFIRSSAPRAIGALSRLIENPNAKDHARGIAMVLDRTMPVETQHTVKVQHDTTENFKNAAQVMARISELAAKYRVRLPAPRVDAPGIIDGEFSEVNVQAAE